MSTELKNKYFYRKNFSCYVTGFIVPKEFISNLSLADLERVLGFATGRLKNGAAFARLNAIPAVYELAYYGDTGTAAHRFEEKRNKTISKDELNKAAYQYLRPSTELIKVIPLDNPDPLMSEDENWPPGIGAMQYRLKMGVVKPAIVIDVIESYPGGMFR
jgi:hypothetical protein